MTAAPVVRAASAGAVRRLVQSAVIFAVLAASSAAALLGLALLATANEGFFASCAVTHCAQLAMTIDTAKVTAAQLARTRHLPGVTQTAGPYPQTTIMLATGGTARRQAGQNPGPAQPAGSGPASAQPAGSGPASAQPAGSGPGSAQPAAHGIASAQPAGSGPASGQPGGHGTASGGAPGQSAGGGLAALGLTVVGRASPRGPLDHVIANPSIMDPLTHGKSRWPSRPGQISLALGDEVRIPLGSRVTVTSAPGKPKLTVVGYADPGSVSYGDAWVVPSEIPALRASGAPAQEQVLYSFTSAASAAQISADLAEIKRALPAGAVAGSQSWLSAVELNSQPNVNTPFVLAFAVLGLVLAVLITANVVSAAVIASYRRIGVLKSIGFTPAQVTAAYLAQIGVPALAGAVAGTALGNWQVLPVIGVYPVDGEHQSIPMWISIAVPLGMCALAGLAATIPALRAGRLPAVAAIAAGQAPAPTSRSPFHWRGYAPHRLAGKVALPRPVAIGLAAPFSRPARYVVTLAALTFGLAGVILAASLNASIHKINHSAADGRGQVEAAYRGGNLYTLTPSQNAKILAAVRAQPGTLRYTAEADLRTAPHIPNAPRLGSTVSVGVAGRPGLLMMVHAYQGDSSWLGWNMIAGRWYHGPHEVDANQGFLAATGRAVGDSITLTVNGKAVAARIAGEVFTSGGGAGLYTSWRALGSPAGLAPSHYDIALKPGTSTGSYTGALNRALGPGYVAYTPQGPSVAGQVDTSFFHLLALLVAALAGLGVLNSVLMATRERVHDLGVFKAVGMTPWQTLAMVICGIVVPTVVAAAIAMPAGLITQDLLVRQLAAAVDMVLPASFVHVLGATDLLLLALAGLGIAVTGALGPAIWAATARTTTALRAE